MSDTWVAPGWWLASDGRWYPPDSADNEAVNAVLAARAIGAPVVLDLRTGEPVVEYVTPLALVPPPVPATVAEPRSACPPLGDGSAGTRWGGHRRIAPPIGTSPAE